MTIINRILDLLDEAVNARKLSAQAKISQYEAEKEQHKTKQLEMLLGRSAFQQRARNGERVNLGLTVAGLLIGAASLYVAYTSNSQAEKNAEEERKQRYLSHKFLTGEITWDQYCYAFDKYVVGKNPPIPPIDLQQSASQNILPSSGAVAKTDKATNTETEPKTAPLIRSSVFNYIPGIFSPSKGQSPKSTLLTPEKTDEAAKNDPPSRKL